MQRKKRLDRPYKPSVYPFIILRQEGSGALLFNPYTCAEMELGSAGAFIVGMCDGQYDHGQIEARTIERFGFGKVKGKKVVMDTLTRLALFLAIPPMGPEVLFHKLSTSEPLDHSGIPYLSAPKTLIWEVTYACNLSCPHCLTSSGRRGKNEISTKKAFDLIDQLADAKVFQVILTGGEPFLRPDIFELLDRLSQENICVRIDTNGTVLSPKLIERLSSMNIYCLQVSIDGIGEGHDSFRGKKSAFNASCQAIKRLVDRKMRANILTTVTPRNVNDLDRIIDLALELGCSELVVNPFIPAGRGRGRSDLILSLSEYDQMYKTIQKRTTEVKDHLRIYTENSFLFLYEARSRQKNLADGPIGCSAGNDMITIGADGTAYPCPFFHDFPLGNITERSLTDIWHNSPELESLRSLHKKDMYGACKKCTHAAVECYGGCRARAYYEHGSITAKDPACILPIINNKKKK